MSFYADCRAEREGKLVIENTNGYVLYSFGKNHLKGICLIEEIYVAPQVRRRHIGKEMVEHVSAIAKKAGYNRVMASVSTVARGAHENMMFVVACGMRLLSSEFNSIYFIKDL